MAIRTAEATWEGGLQDGSGSVKLGSGAFEGPFTWASRFGDEPKTNPEELLGAAHAGCFSMALGSALEKAGHPATRIHTTAKVHLKKLELGNTITQIDLETEGDVPGIDAATFQEFAEKAKKNCIVSRALASVETITLLATLL